MFSVLIVLLSPCLTFGHHIPFSFTPNTVYDVPYPAANVPATFYVPFHHPLGKQAVSSGHLEDGYHHGENVYNDYADNVKGRHIIKDKEEVTNRGVHGVTGDHLLLKDDISKHGYSANNAVGSYNKGKAGHHGEENKYDVSAKGGFGDSGSYGHRKGHKASGFHKSYQKSETGKDTSYIDENHDLAEKKYGQEFGDRFDKKKWDAFSGLENDGQYGRSAVHKVAAEDGVKSAGLYHVNRDKAGHGTYIKNRDLLYDDAHRENARRKHFGDGYSNEHKGHNGAFYNDYLL
ncbi:hypothetical protein O3M35_007599 [Rhynocoris fuscipes]|uniref:Uncharacterized protein n=1 Tax=Rhynocoris fuscipes TaxID=488301 RepID=A0AAW1DHB3_9HEMI